MSENHPHTPSLKLSMVLECKKRLVWLPGLVRSVKRFCSINLAEIGTLCNYRTVVNEEQSYIAFEFDKSYLRTFNGAVWVLASKACTVDRA